MALKTLKSLYTTLQSYYDDTVWNKGSAIKVFNFWNLHSPSDLWFYQFIDNNFENSLLKSNPIAIFSVFGSRRKITLNRSKIKIFFTGENVNGLESYRDHCLNEVDIAMGFEHLDHPRYVRFPLWILNIIDPHCNFQTVSEEVKRMSAFRHDQLIDRNKFCALICRHDQNGIRTEIYDLLSKVGHIDSAGDFLNNTDSLKSLYGDCKESYLKNYKFNICPENSNTPGYVTEKIFEAIQAGCIPVYWGNQSPEPNVLNKDAILFYHGKDRASELEKEVYNLYNNEKMYKEFVMQERFAPTAAEFIWNTIEDFRAKLAAALKQ